MFRNSIIPIGFIPQLIRQSCYRFMVMEIWVNNYYKGSYCYHNTA